MLTNSQKKADNKRKAWELLTYYCYVALDCQTVYNKQSPRQMI